MTNQTKSYNISEIYKNSPLVEVICEIKFPGNMSIDCHKDIFYDAIKKEYPNIFVPNIPLPGNSLALEPYRFENKKNNAGVILSMNKFAYFSRDYNGHKMFINEFIKFIDILKKVFQNINILHRIGWRYINVIPFGREDELLPIDQFFNIKILISPEESFEFFNINLNSLIKAGNGNITIKLETAKLTNSHQEIFLLDFDYAITKDLTINKINNYLNEAHIETRTLFEKIITHKYRDYLRGDKI